MLKEILDENDTDPEEPRYLLVTAGQLADLLNITSVTSADFNSVKALVQGDVDTFLGFKFIRTERLGLDIISNRQVLGFCQSAIGLAVGSDIKQKYLKEQTRTMQHRYFYLCLLVQLALKTKRW